MSTSEEVTRISIFLFTSLIVLVVHVVKGDSILHVTENEVAELNFPYPCHNISRITLQYGNRAPSYSSVNPSFLSLPSNQHLKNISANGTCFLHLTISLVSRNDAGTYILTGYNENGDYIYDTRIGLRVNYPPGKASCESRDQYIEGEWISLQCSASVGNVAGQIICYQDGIRLPPWTELDETGGRLNQIIWARLEGMVYCCSSILQQSKDRCECKDFEWDPKLNTPVTNVTDPCPPVSSTAQTPTSSLNLTENSTIETKLPQTITAQVVLKNDASHNYLVSLVTVCIAFVILILACVTFIFLYVKFKRLHRRFTSLEMGHSTSL